MKKISFTINGNLKEVEIPPEMRLLDVIRDVLGLTGTKEGCGEGECGACTVLIDGKPIDSCLVLVGQVQGKAITTIEGINNGRELHPLQRAFIDQGAIQCGYCTPGMILSAKALLDSNPNPSEEEIRRGMSGNLCRCTGYKKIVEAIQAVCSGGEK
ncbi:(2Fe-2S)-binding protein [Candidatus Formimonas warabiya]|uniref:(2Fe-2S)-binding protein n=1 Tax=Formimonas warabiya TaxID=1761012 RepID=A0A3G1KYY3_FORW1|nr:(2Fe-2S)-binding protein [Candidatus Formimonas warabiya]ATW27674.1 (2Fe-2S)-binding protein [Candidatus Formimonas warabiya]